MKQTNREVLVLGANGRFGRAAVEAFARAGWRVLAQARRPLTGELPPGVVPLIAPLESVGTLGAAAKSVKTVVYAINPIYTEWQDQALGMLNQALDGADQIGADFLFPGNVYNYGEQMPERLTEDTPEVPTTEKGRIRCAMEAELRARSERGLRCRVIRAGSFFGGGSGSWFDLVITRSLRDGTLMYPGRTDVPHTWAYLPDLARAFVAVAEGRDGPAFEAYHFAGHALTGEQLLNAIESVAVQAGLRPPRGFRRRAFPLWLFRVGGLVVPMWREIARMNYLWKVPHELDDTRLQQTFGPLPQTPLHVALRESLQALGLIPSGPALAPADPQCAMPSGSLKPAAMER